MGYGGWDSVTYSASAATRKASGKSDFDYSDKIRTGAIKATVNELLDPSSVAGAASPFAGRVMREVCITDEHPNPTPLALVLDVTGSNYDAAKAVHAKLPQLFGVLQRTAGIEDPQVLIGTTGDAYSDRVPLQMGHFESDNRIDAQVEAMYLEGNGGSQRHETYELAAYFLARHTHLEPYHKQGRKGYAIFIGDEMPYDTLRAEFDSHYGRGHTVESLIGDKLQADIPTAEVFEELKEQYEVFFLFQQQGAYSEAQIMGPWRDLLGENAVILENPNNVCEFIAGLLAMREGGLDLDDVAGALSDAGFDKAAIASVSKTLAVVGAGGSGGPVAKTDGSLSIDSGGADRL